MKKSKTSERLEKSQVITLIAGLNSDKKYLDALFVSVCFYLGLRGGDSLTMKHEYFDGRKHFFINEEKTKKYRELTIPKSLRKQYELYVDNCDVPRSEFIFANHKCNILTLRGFNQKIKHWNFDYLHNQCKSFSSHSFRKSFGYNLFKNDVPLATISKILNHSSEGITMDYIGITIDNVRSCYMLNDDE